MIEPKLLRTTPLKEIQKGFFQTLSGITWFTVYQDDGTKKHYFPSEGIAVWVEILDNDHSLEEWEGNPNRIILSDPKFRLPEPILVVKEKEVEKKLDQNKPKKVRRKK